VVSGEYDWLVALLAWEKVVRGTALLTSFCRIVDALQSTQIYHFNFTTHTPPPKERTTESTKESFESYMH